jgi:hypothetical protein
VARMFHNITNTVYDTLLIFKVVVCGFCYLRIFKKRHSISGRSLVLFCIILFHLLGNDFQSIPIFFF